MKKRISFIMLVLLSFTIGGCDANNKKDISNQTDSTNQVDVNKEHINKMQSIKAVFSMASLPLIQHTVVSLSPTFSGKRT